VFSFVEDYPKTLLEFEKRFSTEEACLEYLFQLRWPQGFRCPRCQYGKAWNMKGGLYRCVRCHSLTSIIAGTIFQDSKKPLRLWFRAIWHLTNQKYGANALGLQRMLGLGSYHTAWIWLHKLRRAMVRPGRERLLGPVEVDETYMGGEKPGKRGRGAEGKELVVIMVEVKEGKTGRIRLKRIADASAPSLEGAIGEAVEPGSIVRSDGWEGYSGKRLSKIGYSHEIIRADSEVGKNLLPRVNRVAALLKRWILGTYQGAVTPSHLDYYLDEFTFRFNRRTSGSRGKLFYRLVQQSVAIDPMPASKIYGGTASSQNNIL
jgi:transposase-like protein